MSRSGGSALAVGGILLIGLNLRSIVSGTSPLFSAIATDIPLGVADISLLGILPPMSFAVCALMTPEVVRRLGLEFGTAVSVALVLLGLALRASSQSVPMLVAGTIVALAGTGILNVAVPPAIGDYAPRHVLSLIHI